MSEKSKLSEMPDPEEILQQELALADIKARHAARLEELGMADKGRALVPPEELTDMSQPGVVLSRFEEDGVPVDRVSMRFTTPQAAKGGTSRGMGTSIPIVDVYPDSSVALNHDSGFSMLEAEAAMDMAGEFRKAQNDDLPHLTMYGGQVSISDPRTHIAKNPPQERKPLPPL